MTLPRKTLKDVRKDVRRYGGGPSRRKFYVPSLGRVLAPFSICRVLRYTLRTLVHLVLLGRLVPGTVGALHADRTCCSEHGDARCAD